MPEARIEMKTPGFKALGQALQQLPEELSADILAGAVRAGAEVIALAAQTRAPARRGRLRRGIVVQVTERGAQRGVAQVRAKAKHSHLVEFGHQLVKGGRLGKGGRVVGHVPAHPFLRPAFDERKEEAVARIGAVLGRTIDEAKALRRLGARNR